MATLLDLPREIRDTIYSYVIAAPNSSIYINAQKDPSATTTEGRIRGRIVCGGSTEYVHTALWCVNKALASEALAHLYSRSIFHPASPLSHFVAWLRSLSDKNRGLIRRLDFSQRTFMPLLFDNTPAWSDLYAIITGSGGSAPMRLNTVFIHVPLDFQLYVPSPALGLRSLLSNRQQFWWPSVKFFVGLLANGRTTAEPPHTVKQLHIVLPTLENRDIPAFQQPLLLPLAGPDAVDLEKLEAVRFLRSPRSPEDDVDGELEVLAKMKESGTRGPYTKRAWTEWHASEPRASRPPLDFHVRWEPMREAEVLIIE